MNIVVRAALFVVALVTVFAAAFGIGTAYDEDSGSEPGGGSAAVAHDEYELRLLDPPTESGNGQLRFVVEDHDGEPVTDFDVRHEKRLHLIVVDTGYTGFQHVHPTMAVDGTWTTPLRVATGRTEVYADFRPAGGEDVVARSRFDVEGPLGSPVFSKLRTQQVDGYTVTVLGDLAAGGTSALRFEISRGGEPVTDLEPYLGAFGHLVMLRKADGEYLHVHPEDGEPGPQVAFAASIPSAARYHLYLDFKHAGKVRTAMFVLDAGEGAGDDHGEEDSHGEH